MSLWDVFQHVQIAENERRIERLRTHLASSTGADARQDARLEALEADVCRGTAMVAGLLRLLREKGLASEVEIDAAIQQELQAAEKVIGSREAKAPKPARRRSSHRFRKG